MLKLLLFVSFCLAEGNYVKTQRINDDNEFADWKWSDQPEDEDIVATKSNSGFYMFDKNSFYSFEDVEPTDEDYPQTEFYVEGGDKVYVKYDPDLSITETHKIAYKPQDLESTDTKFIFHLIGRNQDINFNIYTPDRADYASPVTIRMEKCKGEGCASWACWFGPDVEIDDVNEFAANLKLNIEYVLGDENDYLDSNPEGYQYLKIREFTTIQFNSIRFNRAVDYPDFYGTTIAIQNKKIETPIEVTDAETGTTCSVRTNPTVWDDGYYQIQLKCKSSKGFTPEETNGGSGEGNNDGGENGNKEPIKCDSSKHLEANKEGTECVCMKNYEKKGDKCEKKDSGAFSTFILAVLAILFFLF